MGKLGKWIRYDIGSYFIPKKIPTSEFVYPKKSLLFLAYPKNPSVFLHQQILLFIFWNNWVSNTSLYGFINHIGKLDIMLLIFSRELLHTTKMGSQLTGPLTLLLELNSIDSRFEFNLQNQFSLRLFLHSNVIIW